MAGIDIDEALAQIYEQIESLRQDAADLERIKSRLGGGAPTHSTKPTRRGNEHKLDIEDMTLIEAVRAVLEHQNAPMSTRQITDILEELEFETSSDNFRGVVSTMLNKYKNGPGGIISLGRGLWGLSG